jgi:beta-lactamase superfamily II metal-dependent hydrolase
MGNPLMPGGNPRGYDDMAVRYVSVSSSGLRDKPGAASKLVTGLIWGDRVDVIGENGDYCEGTARRQKGWIKKADLGDESLLEIYVSDVGQGDSILIRTPDSRWHLIDAGNSNDRQMTRKGMANFLRWKFKDDLGEPGVALENVIVSHPDYDHYGGMLNVLSGDPGDGYPFTVAVRNFYHSGMGKFKDAPRLGKEEKGKAGTFPIKVKGISETGSFITELLDGGDSFTSPPRAFKDDFVKYAALVGGKPQKVSRLSHKTPYLPGYGPGQNDVTVRVLGPVLETLASGSEGLRVFKSDSETVNGHSVVLRLDYGNARILLSGDLNAGAQRLLMSYHPAEEFAADVFKACHHGSDDVDYAFLRAVGARSTVISSGDNESYSHPRPLVVGASGRYGRESKAKDGSVYPPLVYSTEIARSVALGFAQKARVRDGQGTGSTEVRPENADVKAERWADFRALDKAPISTNLVYGLVNIRTDGKHILCATMKETGNEFDYRVFEAGTDV